MGWKYRAWYLSEHASELFDRNGNAGSTVWVNGRVVGGWAQTGEGDVLVEFLGRVDAVTRRMTDAERDRLQTWLGDAHEASVPGAAREETRDPLAAIVTHDAEPKVRDSGELRSRAIGASISALQFHDELTARLAGPEQL